MIHFFLKMRYWFRFAAFLGLVTIAFLTVRYVASIPANVLAGKASNQPSADDAFQAALAASLANERGDGPTAGEDQPPDQSGGKSGNTQ